MKLGQKFNALKAITIHLLFLFVSGANAETFKLDNNTLFYSTGDGAEVFEIDWGTKKSSFKFSENIKKLTH